MWSDGVTLWVGEQTYPSEDRYVVRAYRFNPEGRTPVRDPERDLPLHVGQASGLWSDGERIWVGDSHSRVYVYCLDAMAACHANTTEDVTLRANLAPARSSLNIALVLQSRFEGRTHVADLPIW